MNTSPLIHIKKLSCSYNLKEQDKVLYIDNLVIESGKIVFLLGASGSGKSTLLETLGLMNNTIASGTVQWNNNSGNIELGQLWQSGNVHEINRIRKEYLSFIFQNTNLMENFTAYENICLSQMIKKNINQDGVMNGAIELMTQVGLPLSQVGYETVSVNLSGGQRQRISFVRALNNDFKILLCDEPTGNLDEVNAQELMNIVRQNLDANRSAVIVSHDVNLAMKYADEIILITKNEKGYGEILPQHIYSKDQWQNLTAQEGASFRRSIISKFTGNNVQALKNSVDIKSKPRNNSYKQLFQKKESKVLFGKALVNLWVLITILSLTFLAVGFANGTLSYLDKKLNDVFVNWITVMIPSARGDEKIVEELTDILNQEETRKKFLIDTASAYKETALPFFKQLNKESKQETEFIKGRLIDKGDRMMSDLLSERNYVSGNKDGFLSNEDIGLVVTQAFLKRLGYPDSARVVFIEFEKDTSVTPAVYFQVPVVIRTVIKDIPNRNKFLATEFFFKSYNTPQESVFDFRFDNRKQILFFVEGEKSIAVQLQKEIENAVGSKKLSLTERYLERNNQDEAHDESEINEQLPNQGNDEISLNDNTAFDSLSLQPQIKEQNLDLYTSVEDCDFITKPGNLIRVDIDPIPHSYVTTKKLIAQICELPAYKKNQDKIIRCIDPKYSGTQADDIGRYDYLSIVFKKDGLNKVDSFAADVNKNLNTGKEGDQANVIEMDSAKTQEIKNFRYVSNMTKLIALLLIVFSILSISLFISNLLKTHLNKVKMNLGTYKAFGLSDSESVSIYLRIMLNFIFIGTAISLIVAMMFGVTIEAFIKSSSVNLEDQLSYFELLNNTNTYLLLGIIILVAYVVSIINIKRILSKTPGDLIYNR